MKEVPQNPYWLRHSPANGHGIPVQPSNFVVSSEGAGVIGAGVFGGLVGRSVGFSVSGVGSRHVVKAKHFWSKGQSSLFDEGHASEHL